MSGGQLKVIMRANKITILEFAKQMGYNSKTPILNAQKKLAVPSKMQEKLYEMLGLDFLDNTQLFDYVVYCINVLTTKEEHDNVRGNYSAMKWGKYIKG